ncbi:SdiA-regulated domain-containing protein, partial [Plebeiibacterium sediminum]
SPSAVAMSNNRDLYVLSARGSMLLVIGFNSEIKEITFLNPKYLPQPEGICFDDDGNLYLSTEGKKNKGKLLYYRKIQK